MAFKTKKEKNAFRAGMIAQSRKSAGAKCKVKKRNGYAVRNSDSKKFGLSAENKTDRKPVFDYTEFFDFDENGYIKGSYIDGKFIPD